MISVRSPAGSLWQQTSEPQVWLSGGIGITPFRSIIRHLLHIRASLSVTHFHSDRTRATAPFLEEFESYVAECSGFNFLATMTGEEKQAGLRGRITGDMIAAHASEYLLNRYFVVGTDSFIVAMRKMLTELGISPTQVRTEKFDGYKADSYRHL